MELSFSPRPQTLSSILPLLSSSSPSHFNRSSSIRKEFFGRGIHPRLQSTQSRRRHDKLVFQVQTPKCLSENLQDPIIAAAVAITTITVLQMIYLHVSNSICEAVEGSVKGDASVRTDNGMADKLAQWFRDFLMMLDNLGVVGRENFLGDIPQLPQGKQQDVKALSDISALVAEHRPRCIAETNQANTLEKPSTVSNELVALSYDGPHSEFTREFSSSWEAEQHDIRSISNFKHFTGNLSIITLQDNKVFHSRLRSSFERRNVLSEHSPSSADDSESLVLTACSKRVPINKDQKITRNHGFSKDAGNWLMDETHKRTLSGSLQANGSLVKDAYDLSAYTRAYNRLLRDARLGDCLDLLESMERRGLLDMDKFYHTKFLNVCKSQRAVKEALRFVKLIEEPKLSTFNSLLSVCASSQDFESAFQVMLLVKEAGLKPDCKLYTTLISTCAKCGKVSAMFEVFHEMINAGVEPNVNTYGALIDGCARTGQVAKAFGAYGIMRSKKVQPDRVVFNALISACGQSGAVGRAFDVLAEMRAEPKPLDPDHVTVGALMKACIQAGQVERAHEVYNMIHQYNIKGTPEVYTIAISSCSQTGNLEFALRIYDDMRKNGVVPDEMFLSTLIDVAGHAGKIDVAFEILHDAKTRGIQVGLISYSSLMGACCNAKNCQKALVLYDDIKAIKLLPTVSTLNALLTTLCDGNQLFKAVEVLDEMREAGVQPNEIAYSVLIVACEKKGEAELSFNLLSKAKKDGVLPNLIMCRCLTGLCLRSFQKACSLGEPVVSFEGGRPRIDNKWTSYAITTYRETIAARVIPTAEAFSQVLGCLQFPRDAVLRDRFIQSLGVGIDTSRRSNLCSFLDGFGEYDTRSFSVLEEAASLGVVPHVSFKESPITVDARNFQIHIIEVYILTILKGLKHRLAAGARLPNITILLPTENTRIKSANEERKINVAGRYGPPVQAVADNMYRLLLTIRFSCSLFGEYYLGAAKHAKLIRLSAQANGLAIVKFAWKAVGSLLRRLGLPYIGDESHGKIRINGLCLRRWFKPKLTGSTLSGRPFGMTPLPTRLAKGISEQQRNIRCANNLSLE